MKKERDRIMDERGNTVRIARIMAKNTSHTFRRKTWFDELIVEEKPRAF